MSKSMSVYNHPSVIAAKQRVVNMTGAKSQFQAGLGQTKDLAIVGGGAYAVSRLDAHLGGAEGKKLLGMPLPLVIGGVCACGTFASRKQPPWSDCLTTSRRGIR